MTNLRLGDLFIHAREEGLTLVKEGSVTELANIEIEDVPEIMVFLRTYLERTDNRRLSFRLDLTQLDSEVHQRLRVSVMSDRGSIDVKPLNISVTGMYVESETLPVWEGQDVIVRIMFEGHLTVICGSVVRVNDASRRFALHFPDVIAEDGSLDPPSSLSDLFGTLESIWLNKILNLDWNP